MAQVNQSQVNQVTKDLQYYILHPSEVRSLPPEEQDRLANELEDLNAQEQARVAENIKKANLPPSQTEEVLGALLPVLGTVGGIKGGQLIYESLFPGAEVASTVAETAAPVVAQTAAQAPAVVGAGASAASPAASGGFMFDEAGSAIGSAMPASAGAPAAAEPGIVGLSQSGVGGPALATALYYGAGGMDTLDKIKNGETRDQGLVQAAMMSNPMTSWAWPAVSPVANYFSTGKDKDQLSRDAVRKNLVNSGALGKDYKIGFSNGSSFDIGKDGGARLQNSDGGQRRYMDADFSNSGTGDIVGLVQPLAAILAGPEGKLKDDFTGYLVNAVQQSGMDPKQAAQELYKKFGFDKDSAWASIDQMQIDPNLGHAYRNGLNTAWGGGAPAQRTQQPQQSSQPSLMQTGSPQTGGGMSQSMPMARTNIPVGNRPMSPSPAPTPTTPSVRPQSKGSVVAQALTRLNPPSANSLVGLQRKPIDKEKKATVQKVSKVLGALGR